MPMSTSSNENLFSHKERVEIEVMDSRLEWMFMKEYTVSVYIKIIIIKKRRRKKKKRRIRKRRRRRRIRTNLQTENHHIELDTFIIALLFLIEK